MVVHIQMVLPLFFVDVINDGDPVLLCITHIFITHEGHTDIVGKLLLPAALARITLSTK